MFANKMSEEGNEKEKARIQKNRISADLEMCCSDFRKMTYCTPERRVVR